MITPAGARGQEGGLHSGKNSATPQAYNPIMKVGVLVRKKSRNVDAVMRVANIANRLQSDFEFDVEQVDWLQKGNGELRPSEEKSRFAKEPARILAEHLS